MKSREEVFELAATQYWAGQAADAAVLVQKLLIQAPEDAATLELAALVALSLGDRIQALAYAASAAAVQPHVARYQASHGVALGHAGQHAEAAAAYQRAIALQPDYVEPHHNLGIALSLLGQPVEAEASFRVALALRPNFSDAWISLGDVLQMQNRLRDAVAAYETGIRLAPRARQSGFGHTLRRLGRRDAALTAYRADTAHYPQDADTFNNLAAALIDSHVEGPGEFGDGLGWADRVLRRVARFQEARGAAERAIALRPDFQEAHNNLGNILRWLDCPAEAEPVLRRAIALRPGDAGAYNNLGLVLQELHRHEEAGAVLDLGIALAPQEPEIAYSRATGLLRQGKLAEGWAAYDSRFRIGQAGNSMGIFESQTPWRGEPAAGRTLLLLAEQGLGDTIQFVRYVPMLAERGISVVVAAQAPLLPLLRTLAGCETGDINVINQIGNYPPYDLHCPMMSLPRAFATTLETIPSRTPYLAVPDDAAQRALNAPLRHDADKPGAIRVGLAWGGNPRHANDLRRSVPFAALAPLFQIPGILWFSLQLGERAEERLTVSPECLPAGGVKDLTPQLADFAETAAIVAQLDLVICADTAVAHLTGALGKPVWLMLPHTPDWRWLATGSRSPWYPSMRLFRQDTSRKWSSVIAALADALAGWRPPVAVRSPLDHIAAFPSPGSSARM